MIEYPTILSSSKAPRKPCIAFEKLDGSNIRVKYTQKRGFDLFGSRHELIDASHPFLGEVISVFHRDFTQPLTKIIKKEWPNERELIAFGEFFGEKSFAGQHYPNDPKQFVLFDMLICGKPNSKFVHPKDFVELFGESVKIPKIIYRGNMNDELIKEVRDGKYDLNEGVVCKGLEKSGAFRGGIWMCKIKTQAYFDKLKVRFGPDWEKYGE